MIAAYVALQEGVSEEQFNLAFPKSQLTQSYWVEESSQWSRCPVKVYSQSNSHEVDFGDFSGYSSLEGESQEKIAVLADIRDNDDLVINRWFWAIILLDTVIFYGEGIAKIKPTASQMFPIGSRFLLQRKQLTRTNLKT